MVKIYIAGKMRGIRCYNFEEFFYWAKILRDAGNDPVNPAENDVKKMLAGWVYSEDQYAGILIEDLGLLKECDAIFMLKSWRKSDGAKVEKAFAEALGKEVLYERDWV